jgi:hypothetical protein
MKVRVECYSGRKADERPVRFQLDERDYLVEEVLDQWYGPGEAFFKVRVICTSAGRINLPRKACGDWNRSAPSGDPTRAFFTAQCSGS